jgi:type I restriction enzyme M protein
MVNAQRQPMDQATHNRIVSFLWGIADDVLRDLFKRGKYPDVILPMCVLRRLDAVLEPTKAKVLEAKQKLDAAEIKEQDAALRAEAGQAFYNISPFTLRDLTSRGSEQQLRADFEAYLEGFSENVQDILENFKFRNHIPTLSRSDSLGTLISKFLDPQVDLSPASLDNHAMGTVFEELVRRFNEENNEEAGEHWTPRDAVRLMTTLMFRPIAAQVKSGSYLLYDAACGTGGMLTVGDETLRELAAAHGQQVVTHLYGQEINPETYAVCKADMLLKGEGENADNIMGGAEWSTLSHDAFPARVFDFMISNPPYGKSWKKDLEAMGGKKEMKDPRFQVSHQGEVLPLVTRSSDGQMLFLANMASKMNHTSPLGSRIAQVHNGSSLFTGDAGSGESNIRRWLFENDWVEAIVALPLNLFYNTGIATYVWLLSNRKAPERQGKVQLIDASGWFEPLRKNLGKKNCELSSADIERVMAAYDVMEESEHSKIFANEAFGYWKVSVERPLRLHSRITPEAIEALRTASGDREIREELWGDYGDALLTRFASLKPELEQRLREWSSGDNDGEDSDEETDAKPGLPEKRRKKLLDPGTWQRDTQLAAAAEALRELFGDELFDEHNEFRSEAQSALKLQGLKLGAADLKLLLRQVSWREENAPPVIAKVHKGGKVAADPLHGLFELELNGKACVVEYEPDTDLRDSEQIPLLEEGGIEAFIRREVLPYTPDAWINPEATKVGYEVSFTRHFYKPKPLRSLAEIAADIRAIEAEAEGLLDGLLVGAG